MRLRALLKLVVSGLCLALLSSVQADEVGKLKFSTCSGCHAIPGYTNTYPTYHVPKLGGQKAAYIVSALTAYQGGNRNHETMVANAADLNTEEMEKIGAYVAGFSTDGSKGPIYGNPETGKEKAAACVSCHGEDGVGNKDMEAAVGPIPILAGQYQDYLAKSLQDYRSGKRVNATMQGMVAALSDEDITNIAAYYASLKPALTVVKY